MVVQSCHTSDRKRLVARLLVSMAPLSNEIRPVSSCTPQHLGPAIPEVNSVWFKLFLYSLSGSGPPSLLLVKGTRLRRLPEVFQVRDLVVNSVQASVTQYDELSD